MNDELIHIRKIRILNIIDMGLSFSAMIRLFEKDSKRIIQAKIYDSLDNFFSVNSKQEFEECHNNFCKWGIKHIILAERVKKGITIKERTSASYGQIAKTLDVVLKVVINYCHLPEKDKSDVLKKWIHPAIDNKMMRLLRNHYPKYFQNWPKTVEAVNKEIYKDLQELVKKFINEEHNETVLPIDFDDIYWRKLNRQEEVKPKKSKSTFINNTIQSTTPFKIELYTRGGVNKRVEFKWWFDKNQECVKIVNNKKEKHDFQFNEILKILQNIKTEFNNHYFPLANNVAKLTQGTEIRGLGTVILNLNPGDIRHAQGASYIGPVLENIGYFEWNGKVKGIMWCLKDFNISSQELRKRLVDLFP